MILTSVTSLLASFSPSVWEVLVLGVMSDFLLKLDLFVLCNETGSYLNFCLNWFSMASLQQGKGEGLPHYWQVEREVQTLHLASLTPKAKSSSFVLGGGGRFLLPTTMVLTDTAVEGMFVTTGQWSVTWVSTGPPLTHPVGWGEEPQAQVPCVFSTDPVGKRGLITAQGVGKWKSQLPTWPPLASSQI